MSRHPRPTPTVCRTALAGAAAVVVLTGCGGSATSSPPTASAAGPATAGTPAAAADADFCARAAGIDDRVEAALSGREGDDPSVADAFHRLAEELRGIEAPAAISGDWQTMAGGLDRMADALAGIDLTDPDSLTALDEAEGDLSSASSSVEDHLRDQCGIEP